MGQIPPEGLVRSQAVRPTVVVSAAWDLFLAGSWGEMRGKAVICRNLPWTRRTHPETFEAGLTQVAARGRQSRRT